MTKPAHQPIVVYGILLLALYTVSCGPKTNTLENKPPTSVIKYEDESALPTAVIPKSSGPNSPQYVPLPKKIINTAKTDKPVEIILGETELQNSKISYNSIDRQMTVTGTLSMLNEHNEKIESTPIVLTGTHENNQPIFILNEKSEKTATTSAKKILVSAQANCLSTTTDQSSNLLIDCNHVMVDVYILYNNKYYTEQIELNRKNPEITEISPAPMPAPAPETLSQDERDDQSLIQQREEGDESLRGRYQGSAETIDLNLLFTKTSEIEPTAPHTPDSIPVPLAPKPAPPEIKQTKLGDVRPVNQAFGFPDEGTLQNATSLLTRQQNLKDKAFFEVVAPDLKKYYATYEMAEVINRISNGLNKQYSKKLYVSNLSAQYGGELTATINGKITKHLSHQNGLDADLGYPTDKDNLKFPLVVRMKTNEYFPDNFSVEKTYNLFKNLFSQKDIQIDRIFVDQKIKNELCAFAISKNELSNQNSENLGFLRLMFENIQHVNGHGDHFHVRIKCSKLDPGCRSRIYKKMQTCEPAPILTTNN